MNATIRRRAARALGAVTCALIGLAGATGTATAQTGEVAGDVSTIGGDRGSLATASSGFGSLDHPIPTGPGAPVPLVNEPAYDPTTAAGGQAFISTSPDSGEFPRRCSLGLNGTYQGEPVVITAAHCARFTAGEPVKAASATLAGSNDAFGTFDPALADTDLDVALIRVNPEHAAMFANPYVHVSATEHESISRIGQATPGDAACAYGARSGYSCGAVVDEGETLPQQSPLFVADVCGLRGDSGGAMFDDGQALGIMIQSNAFDATNRISTFDTCSDAAAYLQTVGTVPQVVGVRISSILDRFPGLRVNGA